MHGLLVHDPAGPNFIARERDSDGRGRWHELDAVNDLWTPLTQATEDGSVATTGLPNIVPTETAIAAAAISTYGVIAFITPNSLWLYKHAERAVPPIDDGGAAVTPDGGADSGDHEDGSNAHYDGGGDSASGDGSGPDGRGDSASGDGSGSDGGGDSASGDGSGPDLVMQGDDSPSGESARLVSGCSCSNAGTLPLFFGLFALCFAWRRRS